MKNAISEAQILRSILDYLAARHVLAFRMNTLAMPTADGKRFIKAGVRGMADILAFPPGVHNTLCAGWETLYTSPATLVYWLEVKTEKGKQSEFQKSFQAQVEAEGHTYRVVRSVQDVEDLLR